MNRRQSGVGLLELLIGVVVGLFLVAGAIQSYVATKRSSIEVGRLTVLQENLRFAVDFMTRDIREAGFHQKDWLAWNKIYRYDDYGGLGMVIKPTVTNRNGLLFRLTAIDDNIAFDPTRAEPTWPTTAGNTVTDGRYTWTAFVPTAYDSNGDDLTPCNGTDISGAWGYQASITIGTAIRPSPNGHCYIALNAGTTGDKEPTWPGLLGGGLTVLDGSDPDAGGTGIIWEEYTNTAGFSWIKAEATNVVDGTTYVTAFTVRKQNGRDCFGFPSNNSIAENTYSIQSGALRCSNNNGTVQDIIDNVESLLALGLKVDSSGNIVTTNDLSDPDVVGLRILLKFTSNSSGQTLNDNIEFTVAFRNYVLRRYNEIVNS